MYQMMAKTRSFDVFQFFKKLGVQNKSEKIKEKLL